MKDEIIVNNLNLIYRVMNDLHCNTNDEEEAEDYYFAGLMGLIKASKTYDKTKSNSKYLYICIKNEILRCFIKNTTPKYYHLKHKELSDKYLNVFASEYNLEKEVLQKWEVERLLSKLKDKKYKKFLIEYYGINTQELNTKEIAQKYGVSHQFVRDSILRALNKLRKEYYGEDKKNNNKIKVKI